MRENYWKIAIGGLLLATILVWLAAFAVDFRTIKIIACDVGQGDAFLVVQGTTEILIDAGPDDKVVRCLDRYMPFWDRTIELAINSHPQLDHYGGFASIFENFSVKSMMISGLDSSSQKYRVLEKLIGGRGTKVLYAPDIPSMRLGLIYLDILHPTQNFINAHSEKNFGTTSSNVSRFTSKEDPNIFSVTVVLSYKNFDALFTGDMDPIVSDLVSERLGDRSIEYLKVPHHGSKNGMSEKLLTAVNPQVAVISVGKKNKYGHPNQEILDMLGKYDIKTLRTDELGDVVVESDGNTISIQN